MTSAIPPLRIPATYLRGGTSKGVFFRLQDLPGAARVPGPARDRLLLRVLGSPDPYGQQIDGMGGGTSSTSKAVIVSPSERPGHDVDYLFGQVSIDGAFVDWSGNCGNLSAAVGPFAIAGGLLPAGRVPEDGTCTVRIWQANTARTIVAHVPMAAGRVREAGDFALDGVAFPAAEVALEFLGAGEDGGGAMFPTGHVAEDLHVPGMGTLRATLIQSGIPTIFVNAADLGLAGTEGQAAVNGDPRLLERLEAVRAHGALRMGLVRDPGEAATRQHTPKIAFVAPPADFTAAGGKAVRAADVDLLVRAVSMGRLHHAMMGTAAVAIATAAAVPGTLVHQAAGGGGARGAVRFGHPSGILRAGAEVRRDGDQWVVTRALMSRSARVLMEGWVRVPGDTL
ncbi:2-methylaconitate cis-trans isomerase PrpF [Paracidovorax anthurii]|uniref:2-methylaconitate cis-trans isomerase n=1 Tax=Paracidovorax anthurii TaxID=78229 RepID=A0A328Z560_9BURK|nr:2-methylaconitate cis-trans isomerase PrpF [Paracidovorax anthurii]RAR79702.1 2-methylaconitate cis-trans isomerase [Paracidovorax anthurii]